MGEWPKRSDPVDMEVGMARRSRFGRLLSVMGWALGAAAVVKELRARPEDRTWHGRVAGVVPYEFRVPTPERARQSLWNPRDERILTDPVFGVGWSVNFGRVVELLRGA